MRGCPGQGRPERGFVGQGQTCPQIGLWDLLAIQGSWNLDPGDPRQLGPAKTLPTVPIPRTVCTADLVPPRGVFQPATDMVSLVPAPGGATVGFRVVERELGAGPRGREDGSVPPGTGTG